MPPLVDRPGFRSLALDAIPRPDFADVHLVALPPGADPDPRVWAERIFDVGSTPVPVIALMAVRQSLVGLIGIPRADPEKVFRVASVEGEEALIDADDRHLRFCCGVAVDADRSLLRVTTTVQLKGWRGQVYFAPVSLLHAPVVRSMMTKAVRRYTP